MSLKVLDPNPTIQLIFHGLMISHIQDGEQYGQVGAIVDTGCHTPKITVTKRSPRGIPDRVVAVTDDFDLNQDIFLDVENTSLSSVQTFEVDGFDRTDEGPNSQNDFRLLIDFERDVFPTTPTTIDTSKIQPVFHVGNALFHTFKRSPSKIDFIKRLGGPLIPFNAFVADHIGARITLNQPDSKAVLRSGSKVIRTIDSRDVAEGATYIIEFNCECDDDEQRPAVTRFGKGASDFLLVYDALGINLTADQQLDIRGQKFNNGTGGGPVSPEVFCTGPRTGKSLTKD